MVCEPEGLVCGVCGVVEGVDDKHLTCGSRYGWVSCSDVGE